MSQALQLATRTGNGEVLIADASPTTYAQGLGFVDGGAVCIDGAAAIDHYSQGLPMSSAGRICVALNGTVDRVGVGGAPFNSAGRLVVASSVVDYHSAGIPYTAGGAVAALPV